MLARIHTLNSFSYKNRMRSDRTFISRSIYEIAEVKKREKTKKSFEMV